MLAAALAVCLPARASSFVGEFSYFKSLKEAEAGVDAPNVFARLETLPPEARAALLEEKRGGLDLLQNMRSLSGDATGAAQAAVWFDHANGTVTRWASQVGKPLDAASAEDAIEAIVRAAKGRRIVILNEAHHVPVHRVFAAKLARELRKIGFTYLAAEAFALNIPLHPKSVERTMGFYVREPMYAGFVRSAMRDAWSFVGYDHYADSIREREIGAAANIVGKIFAKDPQARVFMYVGYGHAMKMGTAKPEDWRSVATLLREQLGTEPLTISQTTMYARGSRSVEHPQYRAALERFAPIKPIVLKTASGAYATPALAPGTFDMQVVHPDDMMHGPHGRPLWMERQAGLRPRPVPPDLLPASGRRLVQAFHAADDAGAIPADQVMVEAGKPAPAFMLPEGEFRFGYEE